MGFVRDELGYGDKALLVPNGLSDERAAALARSATPEQRAASDTVIFVGTWSLRKGRIEFPQIVRQVRERRPRTRFRLIGTYAGASAVKSAFAPADRDHIEVVPQFSPEQLPALLADGRCGVFPSYVEGFPLSLLEMLAAGLPVVAWDVPGPRELLRSLEPSWLTRPGDTDAIAAQLERLLEHFDHRGSAACGALAAPDSGFHWRSIAERLSLQLTGGHRA